LSAHFPFFFFHLLDNPLVVKHASRSLPGFGERKNNKDEVARANFFKPDHADFQALFGIKFPTRFQILHQDGVDLWKETGSLPAFKVQIADLGGAVAGGDCAPREAMALFPKDAIEEPLLLGEIHFFIY
jgi:hypothetical protein